MNWDMSNMRSFWNIGSVFKEYQVRLKGLFEIERVYLGTKSFWRYCGRRKSQVAGHCTIANLYVLY